MFHFISGLPRSGSTLLAALLRQNPKIHAGMTSPLASMFQRLLVCMGADSDYAGVITSDHRRRVLRAVADAYYEDVRNSQVMNVKPLVVFDTNRYWCSRMEALAEVFPDARVIAMVRDPVWVLDSFERLFRRNPLIVSKLIKTDDASTVYSRVQAMAGANGVVGFAWNAVREAFFGPLNRNMMLITYDQLVREPKQTLARVYQLLKLEPFDHDFEHFSFRAYGDFDNRMGVPGLHDVDGPIKREKRVTVLPPDLFAQFSNRAFWNEAK
jgi:sulfotransferase